MMSSEADTLGGVVVRGAKLLRPADFDPIVSTVDDWWGPSITSTLSRLFLDHFFSTSVIAERDGALVGVVIGFLAESDPAAAYIYFAGVAPQCRRGGIARKLYERFLALARDHGRTTVKAITSPHNATSIAFHRAIGFRHSELISNSDGQSIELAVFARSA